MTKIAAGTRYLIIIPIIGLALASAIVFVFAGFGLISLLLESVLGFLGSATVETHGAEELPLVVEILEYVHTFLIGTVLYITAIGFYQLFIKEVEMPGWLRIDSTEDLETNLIGVVVVVLAINFIGLVFTQDPSSLQQYGVAIALTIAALSLYIGLRTWSTSLTKKSERAERDDKLRHSSAVETSPAAEGGD